MSENEHDEGPTAPESEAPEGFDLSAEAQGARVPGIVARDAHVEHDHPAGVEESEGVAEDDDDDAVEEPDEPEVPGDV